MKNSVGRILGLASLMCSLLHAPASIRADDGLNFFESKIRPLLTERCINCHGGPSPKGGLSLESRTGWQEAGVVESGKPDESLLIRAVRYSDADLAMPPPDAGGKLTDDQIAALEQWISMGAPDPREAASGPESQTGSGPKLRGREFRLSDADRNYWAFQSVAAPAIPSIEPKSPVQNPVDAFLLVELSEKGLTFSAPASPREQVRRAYFDLWGLPPEPEVVAEFEAEPSDDKWAQLIDRLLASPHYGERWGRHWLDLVRYAETNGYERDGEKPNAWRYRDYVIESFNDDKPYDQFVREQLAGDEIAEEVSPDSSNDSQWRDLIVATGFYRLHVWDDEPDSTLVAEYDDLDDIMVTTGTAFLGLTIGCARCHDHKFDPISQADYYSLLSFFRGIEPYGQHKTGGGGRGTGRIERPLAALAEVQSWRETHDRRIKELEERLTQLTDPAIKSGVETDLNSLRDAKPPFDAALAVAEIGATPPITRVLHRGDVNSPRAEVMPAFPTVFGLPAPTMPVPHPDRTTSGRRRALADWISSPQNPLTARVMANRIWQHHFGVGIVPTPDDFGNAGLNPTNQPLLDYLAAQFVESGWKVKTMHRVIMTSQAYRQSSRTGNDEAVAADPENTLLWRQNLRRADAEAIRDTMLAISGALNHKSGGPSVYPTLAQDIHVGQDSAGKGWQESPAAEQNRRSVYLVVKRGLKIPLLESFDFANSTSPLGTRPVTTTAPQALMMLNDRFMQSQAEALADRVSRETSSDMHAQITRAFQLAVQRSLTISERAAAENLTAKQRRILAVEGSENVERQALVSFCRGLLNINEVIYID
jgi:hypothetical protein